MKPTTARHEARAALVAEQRADAAITFGPVPRDPDVPTRYSLWVLAGMQSRPMFAGIVTHAVGQHPTKPLARNLHRRRTAAKAARIARRANRSA